MTVFLPPREAGIRISLVLMATVRGMACGGLAAGTSSTSPDYRLALLHGFLWTIVNLSPVTWLILLPKLRQRRQVATAR